MGMGFNGRGALIAIGIAAFASVGPGCADDSPAPPSDLAPAADSSGEFDPGEDYAETSSVADGVEPSDDELFADALGALNDVASASDADDANEAIEASDDEDDAASEPSDDDGTVEIPADDPSRLPIDGAAPSSVNGIGIADVSPDALLGDGKLVGKIARKNDVYYAASPVETLTNLWVASSVLRPSDAPTWLALTARAVALHIDLDWRPKSAKGAPKELGAHLFGRAVARFGAELARQGISEVALDPPVAGIAKLTLVKIHDTVYSKAVKGRRILDAAAHLGSHDALTALALAYIETKSGLPRKVTDGAIATRNAVIRKHLFTPATNGRLLWGSNYRRKAYYCSDTACGAIAKGCHHMGGMELANVDVSNPCACGVPDTSHANAVVGYALFAERFGSAVPAPARFALDMGKLANTAQAIVQNRAAFIDGFDNITVTPRAKKNQATLREYPTNTRTLDVAAHRRVIAAAGVGAWAAVAKTRAFYTGYSASVWKPSQRCFKASPIDAPNRCGARKLSAVRDVSTSNAKASTASWMLYGATRTATSNATGANCAGRNPGRYCVAGTAFQCTSTGFMAAIPECEAKTCTTNASGDDVACP